MNREVKGLWINALRSGSYNQGHVYMKQSVYYHQNGNQELRDYYCPLGVLCNLHSQQFRANWQGEINAPITWRYYRNDTLPPPQVLKWADLSVESANYIAYLNDTNGDDFNLIAAYIEHSA